MTVKDKLQLMDEMATKNEERRQAYLLAQVQEHDGKADGQ